MGLVPSAVVLAVLRLLEVDSDVIAGVVLIPVVLAAAIGGRRDGARIGAVVAIAYAVALLAPFGHLRIGLTRDMLVLAIFTAAGAAVGELADRRRPAAPSRQSSRQPSSGPLPAGDPTALLNAVSHDLRNPLSTIRAASSDLLHSAHGDDAARREELLGLVVTETERLDRIVGNLLHAGRARAGRIEPDSGPESLHLVVRDALARFGGARSHRLVDAVPVDLPPVMVDTVLLDQVLTNLVENAARFSPAGSEIRIAACRGAEAVVVSVSDDGPGFALGDADPFEAYVSAGGSSGLGLAICRAIVEAHGGTIEVADVPAGACVRFTLPIADV